MARKSTSKRLRFEIFKRDGFACQYCGKTPPAVILEVDHIVPVAAGGDSRQVNLITACFDCNRGKAAISLDQVPPSLQSQIQEQKDRQKQVAQFNKFLMAVRKSEENIIREIGLYWFNKFLQKDKYSFGDNRRVSIKTFLKHLAPVEIMDAMDVAHSRQSPRGDDDERTFRYFCGICWKTIKGENG